MKPCLRLVLKPMGDYPDCKYMGGWDALCTTQQRAFHGQSVDPLTGVQLRQCNPKLFNQITRAWEKILPLNYAWGGGGLCGKIWVPVSVRLCPSNSEILFCNWRWSANVISIQVKYEEAHIQIEKWKSWAVDAVSVKQFWAPTLLKM